MTPTTSSKVSAGPVAVRPESMRLLRPGTGEGLPAEVRSWAYVGSSNEYMVDHRGDEKFVVTPAGSEVFHPGEAVLVAIYPFGVAVI